MTTRKAIIACVLAFCLLCCALRAYRARYPYGIRTACVPMMAMGLSMYARDNEGWLPAGGTTPLQSLQKLFPQYVMPSDHLAGLSGNVADVKRVIAGGGVLDQSISSWIYVEGFRNDDKPPVAVLWDQRTGLEFNARRSQQRYTIVVFSNGEMKRISPSEWVAFQTQQSKQRAEVLASRRSRLPPEEKGSTNSATRNAKTSPQS
jgi:hypothetical protein